MTPRFILDSEKLNRIDNVQYAYKRQTCSELFCDKIIKYVFSKLDYASIIGPNDSLKGDCVRRQIMDKKRSGTVLDSLWGLEKDSQFLYYCFLSGKHSMKREE